MPKPEKIDSGLENNDRWPGAREVAPFKVLSSEVKVVGESNASSSFRKTHHRFQVQKKSQDATWHRTRRRSHSVKESEVAVANGTHHVISMRAVLLVLVTPPVTTVVGRLRARENMSKSEWPQVKRKCDT